MIGNYKLKLDPKTEEDHKAFLDSQKTDLTRGKITIRWSNPRCGWVIYSGRLAVLGLETFMAPSLASEWLWETHSIKCHEYR